MTGFLYGPRSSGAPHLARFSRDVGYHGPRRATLSVVIRSEAEGSAVRKEWLLNRGIPGLDLKRALEQGSRDRQRGHAEADQKEQIEADGGKAAILKKNGLETVYGVGKGIDMRDDLEPLR
jgi:hypothetical protein